MTPTPNNLFIDTEAAREPSVLLASALAIIDRAFECGATAMLPLFSGGHDSLSACFAASQHSRFCGEVHHINTGIGAKATRAFVEETCKELGWTLRIYTSNFSYEKFVRRLGFPGPGAHQWVYNKIKDRCISAMCKGRGPVALITGCRQQESTRRMGHTASVKIGETSKKTGKTQRKNRIWTAPCFDWSIAEQRAFMTEHMLPRNPVKDSILGMSGECFCGAFARPWELEMIRMVVPDVAAEIDRLSVIAKECGTPCEWGKRRKDEKGVVTVYTGPLCSSCDRKAVAAGVLFDDLEAI
jgi:3'-phosphoadenosine 5'-phosphosulfate sulfotransferase (PAPS reductase)/FAD synthetase